MHIAGLTGGTGAGKSSAARRFEEHGIVVIDADKVGHRLIAPGGAAVEDVIAHFGDNIAPCGKISRERLAARVFSDPDALQALNRIMQPRIFDDIARQCADRAAVGDPACIIDAALLGDSGSLEPWLHSLILVSSPEGARVERLAAQRGWSTELAWQRVRAQVDPESKRALARWVIENDSSLDAFMQQVDAIARELLDQNESSDDGTL